MNWDRIKEAEIACDLASDELYVARMGRKYRDSNTDMTAGERRDRVRKALSHVRAVATLLVEELGEEET